MNDCGWAVAQHFPGITKCSEAGIGIDMRSMVAQASSALGQRLDLRELLAACSIFEGEGMRQAAFHHSSAPTCVPLAIGQD